MSQITVLLLVGSLFGLLILLGYLGSISRSIYALKVSFRKDIKDSLQKIYAELTEEVKSHRSALILDSQTTLQKHRALLESRFTEDIEKILGRLKALESLWAEASGAQVGKTLSQALPRKTMAEALRPFSSPESPPLAEKPANESPQGGGFYKPADEPPAAPQNLKDFSQKDLMA